MLIVLSGLPGTGKTTIARELVARWPCVYLRIDTIEQALATAGLCNEIGPAGYVVAYALARSNLAMGQAVLADSVNPLSITREAWRAVAIGAASALLEVEVICSDSAEHRRRVESRASDIPGLRLPAWEAVLRHDYEAWSTERLVIDSALLTASEAAQAILDKSGRQARGA